MLKTDSKVQGVGVYAEFRRKGETLQMLITPDALDTSGELIPMSLHRRVVTPDTPKKQWQSTKLRGSKLDEYLASDGEVVRTVMDTEITGITTDRMRYALAVLDELVNADKNWKIENKPFLVEVSQIDADEIKSGKTPNKVLYRVGITKTALGYPENLI